MSSNKFLGIARRIARDDADLFETLMEFERTKRIRTKTRLNFTIDRNVASRFKKFCKEKRYNSERKNRAGNKLHYGERTKKAHLNLLFLTFSNGA